MVVHESAHKCVIREHQGRTAERIREARGYMSNWALALPCAAGAGRIRGSGWRRRIAVHEPGVKSASRLGQRALRRVSVQSKQREELAEFAEIEHRAASDVSAQLTAQLETAQREVDRHLPTGPDCQA